jgi:hypothetical protein
MFIYKLNFVFTLKFLKGVPLRVSFSPGFLSGAFGGSFFFYIRPEFYSP